MLIVVVAVFAKGVAVFPLSMAMNRSVSVGKFFLVLVPEELVTITF